MTALEHSSGKVALLLKRRGLRQFVKFCIVGATSTVIDFGIFYLLYYQFGLHAALERFVAAVPAAPDALPNFDVQIAVTLAFLVAVTNGFVWNSRWTFRAGEEGDAPVDARKQYAQFVLVNLIGLALNVLIVTVVLTLLPGGHTPGGHATGLQKYNPLIAKLFATAIVVFWNFLANKYWTFNSK